jgi:hypothetical protein
MRMGAPLTRSTLIAGVMALAILQGTAPVLAQTSPPASPAESSQAVPVPSRDQLELQVNILKDYIAKLKENAEKQFAELQANIEKLKTDLVAATAKVDPALMTAQKSAQLRELQYAKEKFDIVVDGYREQRIANRVALLLVVIMVIAGIAFSALQLLKGLRPISATPGSSGGGGSASDANDPTTATRSIGDDSLAASDVEISAGKIRVTSTVVGVVVLVISIAFFYIYMKDLTSIRVVGDAGMQQSAPSK